MGINFVVLLAASIVPLILGFVYYHPKVFGNAWMKASGLNEEQMKGAKMAVIFSVTFLLSLILAVAMQSVVIHQYHVKGLLMTQPDFAQPDSPSAAMLKEFMSRHEHDYRTFRHGALHGALAGFMIALPVLGINALFERKRFKYIAINAGFWIIAMSLMGGIICAFS